MQENVHESELADGARERGAPARQTEHVQVRRVSRVIPQVAAAAAPQEGVPQRERGQPRARFARRGPLAGGQPQAARRSRHLQLHPSGQPRARERLLRHPRRVRAQRQQRSHQHAAGARRRRTAQSRTAQALTQHLSGERLCMGCLPKFAILVTLSSG